MNEATTSNFNKKIQKIQLNFSYLLAFTGGALLCSKNFVGPTVTGPVLVPLAVLHLENQLHIRNCSIATKLYLAKTHHLKN